MTDRLEKRRKQLLFRSWHRGMQELDLLLGSFAEAHLSKFDEGQLDRFEALLHLNEPLMYDLLLGRRQPPAELCDDVMELLLRFEYRPPLAAGAGEGKSGTPA